MTYMNISLGSLLPRDYKLGLCSIMYFMREHSYRLLTSVAASSSIFAAWLKASSTVPFRLAPPRLAYLICQF